MRPEIIENLKSYYNTFEVELKAYTDEGVSKTPYASTLRSERRPTWAEILLEITDPAKQKSLAEFERTMTARYCFELLQMAASSDPAIQLDAYREFIAVQQDPKNINRGDQVLSFDEFLMWSNHFNTNLNHATHGALLSVLLDYLVVYSDLAKTPSVKAWAEAHAIPVDLGGDEIMRRILDRSDAEVRSILPSFAQLSEDEKQKLRLYYPIMTACIGHLYFMEAGPKMLATIHLALQNIPVDERQVALDLIIGIAQMLDMMGARGQESIEGSLTFTHNMHLGSRHMLEAMSALTDAESIRPALEDYIQRRASDIGYANYKTIYPTEAESECFMRLACKLRVFEIEKAQALQQAFDALSQESRDLLAEELSFNQEHGIDSLVPAPNYEATGFHNITMKAREVTQDYQEEMKLALNYAICFAKIVKEMQKSFPDVCKSVSPVSFGKLAYLAREYPDFFDPETFSATSLINEEQLRRKTEKDEFGSKSFVALTLPSGYKKPAIQPSAEALGKSMAACYKDPNEGKTPSPSKGGMLSDDRIEEPSTKSSTFS